MNRNWLAGPGSLFFAIHIIALHSDTESDSNIAKCEYCRPHVGSSHVIDQSAQLQSLQQSDAEYTEAKGFEGGREWGKCSC